MTTATVTLGVLALLLWFYAWRRGDGSHVQGARVGWRTFLRTLPLLLLAFTIVGFVNAIAPQKLVERLIGPESGWQGLLVAEGVGMLLPGGPYVVFPLISAIYHAGAGFAPAITMITSWATQALLTISFELPFMGWRFTAVRWGLGLAFPFLVGALVLALMG